MKFKIGDVVINKKTGFITSGEIIQIIDGTYYAANQGCMPGWIDLYPNWMDKPVYVVLLNKPHKQGTFEEFCEQNKYNDQTNVIKRILKMQYAQLPLSNMLSFPEDDLELI